MQQLIISMGGAVPGNEVTNITGLPAFNEDGILRVDQLVPFWGAVTLTVEAYVANTYTNYTAAAPPAVDTIMFNADCSAFKCGNWLWFGDQVIAQVEPIGEQVVVS